MYFISWCYARYLIFVNVKVGRFIAMWAYIDKVVYIFINESNRACDNISAEAATKLLRDYVRSALPRHVLFLSHHTKLFMLITSS